MNNSVVEILLQDQIICKADEPDVVLLMKTQVECVKVAAKDELCCWNLQVK